MPMHNPMQNGHLPISTPLSPTMQMQMQMQMQNPMQMQMQNPMQMQMQNPMSMQMQGKMMGNPRLTTIPNHLSASLTPISPLSELLPVVSIDRL